MKSLIRYGRIAFLLVPLLLCCSILGACADVEVAATGVPVVLSYNLEQPVLQAISSVRVTPEPAGMAGLSPPTRLTPKRI